MTQHGHPNQQPTTGTRIVAVGSLLAVVVGIVAVAFRGSWGALRDAALACHLDVDSSTLYPFAVDGLIIVGIIAAVLLRHHRAARRYCLGIIGGYTVASWLINFLHGLGQFQSNPVTHVRPVPAWPVVVVVASLLVGSIFLGSHLLVLVWQHLWPRSFHAPETTPIASDGQAPASDGTPIPAPPISRYDAAKNAYRQSLAPGLQTISRAALMSQWGLTRRDADRVRQEVADEETPPTLQTPAESALPAGLGEGIAHPNGLATRAAPEGP